MSVLQQSSTIVEGVDGSKDVKIDLPDRSDFVIPQELIKEYLEIAFDVSKNPDLKLIIGKPKSGSMKFFHTDCIVLDPLMVKGDPGQGRFVTGHEASHDAISRAMLEIGLSRAQAEELGAKLGYGYIHNIIEDPAVNEFMCIARPDLRSEEQRFYAKSFAQQNAPMAAGPIEQVIKQLGYVPKFVQFASELMRHWYTGCFSDFVDVDVSRSLQQVTDAAHRAIKSIPRTENPDEAEIIEKARLRFLIVHEYIWPEIEKLIRLDIDNERRRQQARQAAGDGSGPPTSAKGGKGGNAPSDEGEPSPDGVPQHSFSNKTKEELRKLAGDAHKPDECGKNFKPGNKNFSPADLSPEARAELDRAFAKLSPEEKEKLLKEAHKALKEIEDKLNAELNPKSGFKPNENEPPEQPEEEGKKVGSPDDDKGSAADLSKQSIPNAFQRASKAAAAVEYERRQNLNRWDAEYESVAEKVDEMYRAIMEKILLQRYPDWDPYHPVGQELDTFTAMQAQADPRLLTQLFKNRQIPTEEDWAVSVVVDTSPSISSRGAALPQFQAVVFTTELFQRFNFASEVWEFAGRNSMRKQRHQSIAEEPVREELSKLLETSGSTTHDADAVERAYHKLRNADAKYKLLVIFSDAESCQADKLRRVMREIAHDNNIIVVHYGVGPNTKDTEGYYPFSYGSLAINGVKPELSRASADGNPDRALGEMMARLFALESEQKAGPKGYDFYETFYETFVDIMLNPEEYLAEMRGKLATKRSDESLKGETE